MDDNKNISRVKNSYITSDNEIRIIINRTLVLLSSTRNNKQNFQNSRSWAYFDKKMLEIWEQ